VAYERVEGSAISASLMAMSVSSLATLCSYRPGTGRGRHYPARGYDHAPQDAFHEFYLKEVDHE